MPAGDFRTVADEVLHVAADAEAFFINQGFQVSLEIREIGFPLTPTLVCRRGHETIIVEVSSALDCSRAERWIRYSKSQTVDTRFCGVLRSTTGVDQATMAFAVENRIGLCVHNDQRIMELRAPADLAVHVALPNLEDLAEPLRPLLAPSFKKIRDSDWRDGLNDAYLEVEQHAREYLADGIKAGRIISTVRRRTQTTQLTAAEAEEMTLGQLKIAFAAIQNQTYKEARIASTLALINRTRRGLAHRRRSQTVEAELRLQVGQHMYAVITCLEDILL